MKTLFLALIIPHGEKAPILQSRSFAMERGLFCGRIFGVRVAVSAGCSGRTKRETGRGLPA